MARLNSLLLAGLLVVTIASVASAQIFSDDMSAAANWTLSMDLDSSAEFGYDYSQKGVPAAPNGSDTIGLKFEVNNSAGVISQIVAVHADEEFTGQFTFRVDIWSNWALDGGGVGTGTTEFTGVSVGHDAFAPGPWGGSFIYTGDGDAAATDYRLYKNLTQLQAESGQYALGTTAGARDSSNPILTTAFPAFDIATAVPAQGQSGTQPAGAGGFQWMTVNVEVDTEAVGPSGATTTPGFARFSMRSAQSGNTVEIGTIDNSNGEADVPVLGGTIALLMSDIFSSVAVNPTFSFGLFDNVQVLEGLVPLEPDELVGDYNDDGTVDAADYVVFRKNEGTASALPNDPTGGTIGQAQYNQWTTHFGQTAGGGSASNAAVPEPRTLMLITLSAGWYVFRRSAAQKVQVTH